MKPKDFRCAARMTPDRCICAINIVGVGAID